MASKKLQKKTVRPVRRRKVTVNEVPFEEQMTEEERPVDSLNSPEVKPQDKNRSIYGAVAIAIILAGVYLVKNGYIVAAMVNGKPIFSWQVTKILYNRYGQQTLEGVITESLIDTEAAKKNISVSQQDVDAQEKQVLKSFGNSVSLDDLLKYQGLTKSDFDSQIRLQLTVEKLVGSDVKVTDAEVTNYLATESGTLTATTEAEMKDEAREKIRQDMISKRVQPWFSKIRESAKIIRFP